VEKGPVQNRKRSADIDIGRPGRIRRCARGALPRPRNAPIAGSVLATALRDSSLRVARAQNRQSMMAALQE